MRFLLVDRILELRKRELIIAVKNVSLSEDFLVNHMFQGMIMPYTFIIEAIAQAAGWLITASLDFEKRALLLTLDTLKLNGFVRPGDQLILEAEIESLRDDSGMIKGRAKVGTNLIIGTSYGLFALVDANQLEDSEKTKHMFYLLKR